MAKVGDFGETEITSGALAAMLGKSSQWIRQLTRDGVLNKTPNGKYKIGETTQAYITFVIGESEDGKGPKKSEIEREIAEIKRDEARIRLKNLQGEMHAADDVSAIMGDMITTARQKILSIAPRLAPKIANESAPVIERILRDEIVSALSVLTEYEPELFKGGGGVSDDAYSPEEDS